MALPLSLSPADRVLASVIDLPENPVILYSVFTPTPSSSQPQESIELARRQIITRNVSLSIVDSVLTSAHITKDSSGLYVFAITSHDRIGDRRSTLNAFRFNDLYGSEISSFTTAEIYPCSDKCSKEREPCLDCLNPDSSPQTPPPPSPTHPSFKYATISQSAATCLLPRQPLRLVYSHFLEAVRNRIIDDVSEASKKNTSERPVKRFSDGFMLGPPRSFSEWGSGWEHHSKTRPLIHCHVEIYVLRSRILIHPILRPTHFLPLPLCIPLPPGTPINLIPFGIPAYYLTTYSGPTSTLTTQFEQSLLGRGCGEWATTPPPYDISLKAQKDASSHPSSRKGPMYIIVWISVQNKQGEDKGLIAIWPARLAMTYLPSSRSAHARRPLRYVPELVAQLQPSPPPPMPPTVSVVLSTSPPHDNKSLPPQSQSPPELLTRSIGRRGCTSPTSDSIRAFRTLTLSKSTDINVVADEVGVYVDFIAKEREKERERIRRERENAQSSASPRTSNSTSTFATVTANTVTTPVHDHLLTQTATTPTMPPAIPIPSPSNLQSAILPSQHFYPSPPQSNPPSSVPTSSNLDVRSSEAPVTSGETPPLEPSVPASVGPSQPSTYDPFSDLDAAWSQPTNDFMTMGLDYDMGFGMGIDPIASGGGGGNTSDRINMDFDDDFGAFTDDDFSFFDRPSTNSRVPAPSLAPIIHSIASVPGLPSVPPLGMSPLIFGDSLHSSGPGPPLPTPTRLSSSPWVPGTLLEGFSPQVQHGDSAPDLEPLSPCKMGSQSAPPTPGIQLVRDVYSPNHSSATPGTGVFDAIPFAPSHRIADGKYAFGKFALPSPPDEEDRTEPIPPPRLSTSRGWKFSYNAATDPRVGVVRKLIGVKRKCFDQGYRDPKMSPVWRREYEDWGDSTPTTEDNMDDAHSEGESEEELEGDESPESSRPSTPLPSYLPLGPSLLHTHFHHAQLLPLSSVLRPPGDAIDPTNIATTSAPVSVPTPVSPAAMLGAASEKSKSIEAAAFMVCKEIVENSVWADAWWSNASNSSSLPMDLVSHVWQSDVRRVRELLDGVQELEGSLDMSSLFELETPQTNNHMSLQPLEPPMLSVGKSDSVIQVLPSALRFWEKLGLEPRAGRKDVTAFAFFEDNGEGRRREIASWLRTVAIMYHSKHLGTHTPGSSSSCRTDGLVPLRFDSFRKTLASFVAALPAPQANLVFYLVTPTSAMSLTSPLLRQVLTAVKRALKTYSEAQILFHFVPECLVTGFIKNPATYNVDLERLCYSVYDRVLQPVDRLMSRRFSDHGERIRNYFQEPAFTIARPSHSKVRLLCQAPIRSLDVVDRYTILHVGYQVTPCGRWILAACVDQRGEAHDFGVWLRQYDTADTFVITQVWNFALQFAKQANIEWRIVFSKLGHMSANELDAWVSHLSATVPTCYDLPMVQITLLSVEPDSPWTFVSLQNSPKRATPRKSPNKDTTGSVYLDASAATYSLFSSSRLTLISAKAYDIKTNLAFIPDAEEIPTYENLNILPLASTALIQVPAHTGVTSLSMLYIHLLHTIKSPHSSLSIPDTETHKEITHNFHELAVLGQTRWRLRANPLLPFHLAAIEVMRVALDPIDWTTE